VSRASADRPARGSRGVEAARLVAFLDRTLAVADFPDDSSMNGLQVEGRSPVRRVAVAVDACLPIIEAAVDWGADLLVVHHGLIWGGIRRVTGGLKVRLQVLLGHGLGLYGCHLPLDAHPRYGNNAGILKGLGARRLRPFGSYHGRTIGFRGELPRRTGLDRFADRVAALTGGRVETAGFGGSVRRIAVVSGGGAGSVPELAETDIDTFVTGEPSHVAVLQAEELGRNLVFAGHYATETFGVRAVGELLGRRFGLETRFLDHPTGF